MDGRRLGRGSKVDWYDCDSVVTECGADGREVTKVVENWLEPGRRRNVVKGQPKRSSAYPWRCGDGDQAEARAERT